MHTHGCVWKKMPLTQFEYRILLSVNEFSAVREFLLVLSSPFFVTEHVRSTYLHRVSFVSFNFSDGYKTSRKNNKHM